MTPEQVLADEFNTLRGRILGLIESWGLPERQESGCKATFKGLTYDSQARLLDAINEPCTNKAALPGRCTCKACT